MSSDRAGDESALSHLDERGHARMVDVSAKPETHREATAGGRVSMRPETLALIVDGALPKGDVLATARLAGIMAAKRTHELIPLCHPLPISGIEIELEPNHEASAIDVSASISTPVRAVVRTVALKIGRASRPRGSARARSRCR